MRKVRNFRLHVSPRAVARRLKQAGHLPDLSPASLHSVETVVPAVAAAALPSVIYATVTPEELAGVVLLAELPSPIVAATLVAVTLGEGFDHRLLTMLESDQAALARSIAEETLEEASRWVTRLVADEARREDARLSAWLPVAPQGGLSAVLPLEAIGVIRRPDGTMTPRYTAFGVLPWLMSAVASHTR